MKRKIKKIVFYLSTKLKNTNEYTKDLQSNRIYITYYLFLLTFGLLVARTISLQIFPPSNSLLENIADNQYQKTINLASFRGTIFDRRKTPLAMSIKTPSLAVNPRIFSPTYNQKKQLANILSISKQKISALTKKNNYFAWLKRKVPHNIAEEVKKLKIKGVHYLVEPARYYPGRTIAANLLGFVGIDNTGLFGLEKMLDTQISGTIKNTIRLTDARGKTILTNSHSAKPQRPGLNLILTLDHVIQEITEEEISKWVKKSKAKRAYAIVADPHTGKIFSLANYPSFNPNKIHSLSLNNTINLAVSSLLEPGSITKPVIIASALEKKIINEHDLHYCEKTGRYQVEKNSFIHDDHPKDFMTTAEVVINSSNICTYKIAQMLGKKKTYFTLKNFGFSSGRKIIGLPGEHTGKITHWRTWESIRFANISFGQGFSTNGLEIIRAYSVFANGGYLIKPYIVERIESSSEEIFQGPPLVAKKRVLAHKTSQIMKKILERVILEGTGKNASLNDFTAAGKTGTAEKFDLEQKNYSKNKRIASFVGFAPVKDPHLVAYIVIDEPQKKPYYGGKWAAPAFKNIMQRSLKYLNISPDKEKRTDIKLSNNQDESKKKHKKTKNKL